MPEKQSTGLAAGLRVGRNHDDRQPSGGGPGPYLPRQFRPVHLRHPQVGQNQIEIRILPQNLQSLAPG